MASDIPKTVSGELMALSSSSAAAQAARRLRTHPLHGVGLLVRVPLLPPRIGVKVIAVHLPEAGSVDIQELEGAAPLCALPALEPRHDEPARPAALRGQLPAIVL